MQFTLATDPAAFAAHLPHFTVLAGGSVFRKRAVQLAHDFRRSPFQAKIVADYHWLELDLATQVLAVEQTGRVSEDISVQQLAAMHFAGTLVETHGRLNDAGRAALQGRVRAALQAESGFAPLYLEFDIALRLLQAGFDVQFPDLEGTARCDLRFADGRAEGEVECKSLSVDAGRKIHRKQFYRFMERVERDLARHAAGGAKEILVVTLHDRLPSRSPEQSALHGAISRLLSEPALAAIDGDFFRLTREGYGDHLRSASTENATEFYSACRDAFGHDIHVSGAMAEGGVCLLVMRSLLEDDSSKPWLEAMEKAATQFSGARPAFIAVQFNDLTPPDLILPNFRRRAEILSGAVFRKANTAHVAATFFCPYAGLVASANGVGAPTFAILNPMTKFEIRTSDYPVFMGQMPDDEYAKLVGAA